MFRKYIIFFVLQFFLFSAFADNIDFSGSISTSCSFSNKTTGAIDVQNDRNGNFYLGADGWIGTASSFDIAYDGTPIFSVSAVNSFQLSPPNTPNVSFETGVRFDNSANNINSTTSGANSFTAGTKSFLLDSGASFDTGHVSFIATANSRFPVGNYQAIAVITCQ